MSVDNTNNRDEKKLDQKSAYVEEALERINATSTVEGNSGMCVRACVHVGIRALLHPLALLPTLLLPPPPPPPPPPPLPPLLPPPPPLRVFGSRQL